MYLNEPSVLHTLRQRYGASLLHTYAGPSLLVLSPRGAPSVYSEKVQLPLGYCAASGIQPLLSTPFPLTRCLSSLMSTGLLPSPMVDLRRSHFRRWG